MMKRLITGEKREEKERERKKKVSLLGKKKMRTNASGTQKKKKKVFRGSFKTKLIMVVYCTCIFTVLIETLLQY